MMRVALLYLILPLIFKGRTLFFEAQTAFSIANLLLNPKNREKALPLRPARLLRKKKRRSLYQDQRSYLAADNGVDILVLGAFGCGAFRNDPGVVAKAYANVLKDCRRYFDLIEFAIFCRDFETENYDAFAEILA